MLVAQGNLAEALKSFRASHDIFGRLAQANPGNAGWQRDLLVSFNKIGDVLKAQGNLPEALKSYCDRHAIADRLAQSDPGNADGSAVWRCHMPILRSRSGRLARTPRLSTRCGRAGLSWCA